MQSHTDTGDADAQTDELTIEEKTRQHLQLTTFDELVSVDFEYFRFSSGQVRIHVPAYLMAETVETAKAQGWSIEESRAEEDDVTQLLLESNFVYN